MCSFLRRRACFLVLAVLCAGCGDSGTGDMLAAMNDAVDVLQGIKDEVTARRAKPKLQAAARKYVAGTEKVQEITPERQKELAEVGKQLVAEIARVERIRGGKDALAAYITPVAEANQKMAAKKILTPGAGQPVSPPPRSGP